MGKIIWNKQIADAGTVGTSFDVVLTDNMVPSEMFVSAALADDDATLVVWKDAEADANKVFDGYMANRDADGKIVFAESTSSTTKFIVKVTGGSGAVITLTRYS